jgi:1-phosphofructokinase family hexose kinase
MVFHGLVTGDVNRAASVHVNAAGKAVNVARVAVMLGEKVKSVGFAGGKSGDELVGDMKRMGIKTFYHRVQSPTRVCVTVIDEKGRTTTELVEEAGPVSSFDLILLRLRALEAAVNCGVVVCSGSLAPGVSPSEMRQIVHEVQQHGRRKVAIIDASGPMLSQFFGDPDCVLKCNAKEFWGTFSPDDVLGKTGNLLNKTDMLGIVITDGTEPTRVFDRSGGYVIRTPKVKVVSPIGSGDAVAAGLAVGLSRKLPFPDAVRLGVACGAANAQTRIAGEVDPIEVQRLFESILIHRL